MAHRKPKEQSIAEDGPARSWKRLIPNRLEEVEGALLSFDSFLASGPVAEKTRFNAMLSLEEAVTNVIKYAFADDREHGIDVEARLDPSEIVIEVSDDGREFDPVSAPPPNFDLPFEERPVGGLGIHLLRELTSRMTYERAGGRNHLTLVFHLHP
jgi:anti-sigma regulatory factor (Ser/Thr protein kinase)